MVIFSLTAWPWSYYGYSSLLKWIGDVDAQLKQVNVLRHHAIIINVTCFAHFVHRQALAPANITHLFFVVMKAWSSSFQTLPILEFPLFHVRKWHFSHSTVADKSGNCLDCQLKVFCWTASCTYVNIWSYHRNWNIAKSTYFMMKWD